MEAVKIEGLSKSFGGLQVLADISLRVSPGEHLAVIGPNGAGKTTLFSILSGELTPTAGRLYVFGKEVTRMPSYRRAHAGLARSFQISRLFYDLTVLDNILLALQGVRVSRYQMFRPAKGYGEVLAKAQEFLELIDLWGKRHELMKTISYGEQRKMEFILSLSSEPRVLLLDEPSAGIAIAEIPDFIDAVKTLARDTTLIFTAHDMDVVFGLADRVVVLYFGQFIADGTPEEIEVNPTVREIYLGMGETRTNVGID
jgi:branched-chain amino acid transport system ATP-binding protein